MKRVLSHHAFAALACGSFIAFGASAKTGAPHTFTAQSSYTDVNLKWCKPSDVKELKWHSGRDYNGDTAPASDSQKTVKTWVGSKFTAADLANVVGEQVEAISFFQYRPVVGVTVALLEDGVVVAEGTADNSKYEKNTWQSVKLSSPYKIKAGKEYMFTVCFESGVNMDFVAIKDEAANASGKGDLLSSNGKDWVATANGEYLITAILSNDVDEDPQGYNVYCGNTKLNDALITDLNIRLSNQPVGKQAYSVGAVYADGEIKSGSVEVTNVDYASLLPSPTFLSSGVDMLDVELAWAKPLAGGKELTWSDKSSGIAIGGTASSNTKVWVKNDFDATDLIAFRGGKITAVNYKFAQKVISEVQVFIMKDGLIDFVEKMDQAAIDAIEAGVWSKFTLKEPYQLENGHAYSYGLYVIHTPKEHPMSVDGGTTINVKGNSFSTSSPNSKDFLLSKPSWKTLKSGGMEGNWMMTADIEGTGAPVEVASFDVYRDGKLVGSTNDCKFADKVDDLGTYKYSIVSRAGDKVSPAVEQEVNVKLPAAYTAPNIENTSFDSATKELVIDWNMDKEMAHSGQPAYTAAFEEEMSLMWGTHFTAAELAAYQGYKISKLKFMIGEKTGPLKLGVYTTKGVALSEIEIPEENLTPQAIYTVKLPKAVEITGEEPLVLAYSATIPANKGVIVVDEGPLVENGAKISLTNGANWLNLSTLNPTYGKFNIYISAMAAEEESGEVGGKCVEIGKANVLRSNSVKADKVYGIDATGVAPQASVVKPAAAPKVDHFNIYANGEKVGESTSYQHVETIKRYASFDYHITTVYSNGWESPASELVSFSNHIAQKGVAPFGLKGETDFKTLNLSWASPESSTVYSYVPDGAPMMALKMTGSGSTLTSYCVAKFPEKEIAANAGDYISHIQLGVPNPEISSAAVVVMVGENIIYTQTVPVSTLFKGVNDVRLNEPVKIPAGEDVGVGFIMSYPSAAAHPLGCFACEDHDGFGDLISSSGSSWKTLHTGLKQNYCWYVKGIISKPDQDLAGPMLTRAEGSKITYNVYRDGVLLDNVSTTSYSIDNAQRGRYYVTAVNGEEESGESNAVEYTGVTGGVADVISNSEALLFDKGSDMIVAGAPATISVYNMNGVCMASVKGNSLSVADLASGIYTVKAQFENGKTAITKIVK
ncbi:MAG: T9SS type A sorting domain-containing protein [Muribaculaceae bacterium]|nr:T9SS type A sorting domain-containing protein [Muribaculaceae bacterium]